jgi:hypothetical protein
MKPGCPQRPERASVVCISVGVDVDHGGLLRVVGDVTVFDHAAVLKRLPNAPKSPSPFNSRHPGLPGVPR